MDLRSLEVAKDTGHDSWIVTVAQETDRVKLFLRCRKPTDQRPDDGLRVLKDEETLLWLRVKADNSKDPPINFEHDGAIVASKG